MCMNSVIFIRCELQNFVFIFLFYFYHSFIINFQMELFSIAEKNKIEWVMLFSHFCWYYQKKKCKIQKPKKRISFMLLFHRYHFCLVCSIQYFTFFMVSYLIIYFYRFICFDLHLLFYFYFFWFQMLKIKTKKNKRLHEIFLFFFFF